MGSILQYSSYSRAPCTSGCSSSPAETTPLLSSFSCPSLPSPCLCFWEPNISHARDSATGKPKLRYQLCTLPSNIRLLLIITFWVATICAKQHWKWFTNIILYDYKDWEPLPPFTRWESWSSERLLWVTHLTSFFWPLRRNPDLQEDCTPHSANESFLHFNVPLSFSASSCYLLTSHVLCKPVVNYMGFTAKIS